MPNFKSIESLMILINKSFQKRELVLSGKAWPSRKFSFILETAIGPSQEMQDFDSESFTGGGEHSQKVKAPPPVNDCGSKDCVSWPNPIAVSRIICDVKKT